MPASKPEGELKHIAELSREQRALLIRRLREKANKRGVQESHTLDIQPVPRDRPLPLSFAQQRLWFLAQLERDTPIYHLPVAVSITGPLDVAAFHQGLNDIVRRHEVLRTTFATVDGQPVQVIAPRLTLPLPLFDLQGLIGDEREALVQRLAAEESVRLFDLARGPLLRTGLLRLGPDDHVLLFTQHHIISDGWSTPIFIRELHAFYMAACTGQPAALPELPIQYADYAAWQRSRLQGEVLEEQLAYWRQKLADLPALDLLTDHPRPAVPTFHGTHRELALAPALSDGLAALSRREDVTLFMTLLAAWKLLLQGYTGQDDIVVGTDVANRIHAKTEGLIGFFVNQLVLRTDLSGAPTVAELLGRVRTVCLEAYAHQDLPFEQLVAEIQPDRHLNRTPLFQVKLILQNAPTQAAGQPDSTLRPLPIAHTTAQFDLLLNLEETAHGIVGTLVYSTDLFEAPTIERMLGHFQNLLEGMVANAARRVSDLPLLGEAERRQLLVEWSATDQGVWGLGSGVRSAALCVHHLFEAQAARTPDAIAVVFDRPTTNDQRPTTNDQRPTATPSPLHPFTPSPLHPFTHQRLTYDELNRRANQLAHHLQTLGVGPDVLVAVCMERSAELTIALLGVLKAGGAYLPLDPAYPQARLSFMLEDSQTPILLTQARLVDELPTHWGLVVCLDSDWEAIAQQSEAPPDSAVQLAHLAYVIYTSGSTGQPKGVQVAHRGLGNLAVVQIAAFAVRPESHVLQFASFSFDAAVSELWMALLAGASLHLAPRSALLPGPDLLELLRTHAISHVTLPPSALAALPPAELPALQTLIVAGEACPAALIRAWAPGRRFVNAYGPTEATVCTTLAICAPDQRAPAIGRPIANTQVYVLNARQQPVPLGVTGELYIGGAGLARGYLNRPDLTAATFIPNPFGGVLGVGCWVLEDSAPNTQHPTPNTRLYKTGDLVRYRADGALEFVGRRDAQVKLRGFRIELGEVEAVLQQHPAVREAVAVVREDAPGDVRLVAYIVQGSGVRGQGSGRHGDTETRRHGDREIEGLTQSSVLSPQSSVLSELRGFLQARLPDYMLPAAFVELDALPLTSNGKVDRKALPAAEPARLTPDDGFVAPRTPIEELLATIWAAVLHRDRVGIHDNFFQLGGHSLLVTQLIARIAETFQVELPFRDVFEAPTVQGLAARIAAVRQASTVRVIPPLRPVPRDGPLPLSYAQQRLWFLDQVQPDSPIYNLPTAVRLVGALDVAVFEQSLNEIVRRHEALRTSFPMSDGQPIQVIHQARRMRLPLLDLQDLPEHERETTALLLAAEEAQLPFDLARGPLLRVTLLRLDEAEHVLLLTMHHTISDAWSMGVFIREIGALYTAFSNRQPSPLPELPIQYADYAVWQREWLQGSGGWGMGDGGWGMGTTAPLPPPAGGGTEGGKSQGSDVGESLTQNSKLKTQNSPLQAQLAYWRQHLADLPVLELPTDHSRPPVPTFQGMQQSFGLPAALSGELVALSQRKGVTLFMALLAAWQVLLARYSDQDDIVVGTPITNRNRVETEGLIGFFLNTLVLRVDLSGNPSFQELLPRVREVCLDAYAHQDVPFEQVVGALQPARDLSRHPLFQVMFVLQNAPLQVLPAGVPEFPNLQIQPLEMDRAPVKFDLSLTLAEAGAGLTGVLEYTIDLFEAATIARMAGHLQTLLEGIVDQPERRLADLPLLTDAERQQLLVGWNATAADFPQGQCLHHLFEAQAVQAPDRLAIICTDAHLTYHALNARANQLAHHLQRLSVGPEVRVGLYLERSVELVIGLLAILKVGGAYLALDPTYPPDRVAFMLEDAQVPVLLSQQRMRDRLSAPPEQIICLDRDWPAIAYCRTDTPHSVVAPDHLAYLIYTSGSTGRPKAVMVEHHSIVNTLYAAQLACDLHDSDQMACLASFAFDIALFECFGPLTLGGTTVLLTEEQVLDLPGLIALLSQLNFLHMMPSLMGQVARYLYERNVPNPAPNLRGILVGGDVIPTELVELLQRVLPATQLYLGYGPTENTIISTVYPVPRGQAVSGSWIGGPLTNMQVRLYDRQRRLVPIGVPGEIYLGGAGVTRGYWRREALTQEKYVVIDGQRWYRTGDLACRRPNGMLMFLGRIDQQVKIRGYRIELGEIETVLGQHPNVRECVAVAHEDGAGGKRLVAYIVQRSRVRGQGSDPLASDVLIPDPRSLIPELRTFLKERLPDYMVPAAFVLLNTMPLTPTGKVDRHALPAPETARPDLDAAFVAPRTPVEEVLVQIWAGALGLKRVGVHDNFFALGGDSILSIQIIARAHQAGLQLTPRQMFQHQTIAELAAVAGSAPTSIAAQGRVTGAVPLTPIQHFFFASELPEPHHFNQALLFAVRQPLDAALLEQALRHLLRHHDALRLRFVQTAAGWQQHNAGEETHPVFTLVDLSALPAVEQGTAIEAAAAALQTSLDLAMGPLLRTALFDCGATQPARLLLIIHHLVVDAVSWRILLEDLQTAYTQLGRGEVVQLPPKTTSFQQWAMRLQEYAGSDVLRAELDYWLAAKRRPVRRLPVDQPGGANTVASARSVAVMLSVAETRALVQDVPAVYHTQINDLLLTALVQALAPWSGSSTLLVDLEGHGREPLFDDLDLSRTVGWYTTIFPVYLDLREAAGPGEALKLVKEQLRGIPNRGIGYGLLRYLGAASSGASLQELPAAEVSFNYLGRVDQVISEAGLFGPAPEASGPTQHPSGPRSHLLEINSLIAADQLRLEWTYSDQLHQHATIRDLAEAYLAALRALIAHCRSPEAGGYTPSDFPLARLGQPALDRLFGLDRQLEDIYPLSPMQQGMLFHTLHSPKAGMYVEQLCCTLQGELDSDAFRRAWQQVVARHAILRTAFVWEGLDQPLQVVRAQVQLPWDSADWRSITPTEQERRLAAYLTHGHQQGFDLSCAPLMRMALFQVAEDAYRFVWSHHHLLLDGWSLPLILNEILAYYTAFVQNQEVHFERPQPYRNYIAWLQRQDLAQAEVFWKELLAGFTTPTPLAVDHRGEPESDDEEQYAEQQLQIDIAATTALQELARRQELTLNTLAQGAWAVLLSCYSGETDVVFGATLAGRPPDLAGVETMVGVFINTLPVRVRVRPETPLLDWLRQVQVQQVELRQYEYSPLVQVQRWSEVPGGIALFESIMVFENYPTNTSIQAQGERAPLEIRDVDGRERTNYPLTVVIAPEANMTVRISYDRHRFDAATIARMLGHLRTLLEGIVAQPEQRLADLSLLSDAERHQLLVTWNATTTAYPQDLCIHTIFEAQVRRRPDAVAVVFDGSGSRDRGLGTGDWETARTPNPQSSIAVPQLTYAKLDRRANQVAQALRRMGVRPETRVGIRMERSLELVVGVLGILKAGGAYLPLDPAHPQEREAFIIADARAMVLLTGHAHQDGRMKPVRERCAADLHVSITGSQPPVEISIHDLSADSAYERAAPLGSTVAPDNLAYVIYTSGSTGQPKGVQIAHQAVVNFLCAMRGQLGLSQHDVLLAVTTLAFDIAALELFLPLTIGARVVLSSHTTATDGARLAQALDAAASTVMQATPATWRMLVESGWQGRSGLSILCGGELLPRQLADQLLDRSACMWNLYGPTETTIWSAAMPVDRTQGQVPIGRPIANTQIYVLDRYLRPVPVGVPGELYIGGAGLARGYLDRPDLTAERFIPNPFGEGMGDKRSAGGGLGWGIGIGDTFDKKTRRQGLPRVGTRGDKETRPAPSGNEGRQGDDESTTQNSKLETQNFSSNTQHPTPNTQHLTYTELNERANRLAHHLRGLGVGPEVPVALCLERSLDLIIALLGVLKAGGIYVPLDPSYPAERLAFMLEDSQAAVLITTSDERRATTTEQPRPTTNDVRPQSKIQNPKSKIVHLNADWPMIAQAPRDAPNSGATPENLAYVSYTSGSTGTPKGVSIIHRSVVRLVQATNYAALSAEETFLQLAPIAFDASTFEIWGCLLNGARLVVFPAGTPVPEEVGHVLQQYQVSTLWLTAGLFHLMVDQQLADFRSVRQLLAGGDVLSAPHVRKVLQEFATCRVINGYGPTENTTFTSCHPMTRPDQVGPSVPIGRPIANTQIYLLDRQYQPVPIGVPGELYTGGAGLARGYLHRPDLTAERFIPNPFGGVTGVGCWVTEESAPNTQHPTPNTRLYRTGDLARYRPDGTLEYLGRLDRQIKLRGFRVELQEIEAVLQQHPAVREAAAVTREDVPGEKRLVAYTVMRTEGRGLSGADSSVLSPQSSVLSELRAFLRERLPDYMIPAAFVVLDKLPLTPNGKLDRAALPAPDAHRMSLDGAFAAPATPIEELLAQIWADVLHLERVGIHDNFFELGGHSLMATQVMSRLRTTFHVDLPLRCLFETPTLAELAAQIEQAQYADTTKVPPPLVPVGRARALPLSFAQQRLWFLDQLEPNSAVYNIPTAVSLSGPLQVAALEQSLHTILERHEALRTTFAALDGQPVQVIAPARRVALPLLDLQGLPDDALSAAVRRLAALEARRPFDLTRGPLLRATLLRLDNTQHVALLTMHHIVSDGWSMGVLVREIGTLYRAFATGSRPQLPQLPIQYADYAVWQRMWLQDEVLDEHLAYWKEQLADLPVLELPTDHLRPAVETYRGASQRCTLAPTLSAGLHALSRAEGVTPFMVLLAAFQVLLARYSGQNDIVIGTPIANRTRAEIEPLIGCFVNTLVLRTDLSGNPSFQELLTRVREVCLGAYAHQGLPFEMLVDALAPARDLSRAPLFQVMVVLQNLPLPSVELSELALRPLETQIATAKFDLTLEVAGSEQGMLATLEHNTDLFDPATIMRMLGHFQTLLESVVAAPARTVASLPLLTAAERRQILVEWNATRIAFRSQESGVRSERAEPALLAPGSCCLHQLIEAQAAHTPNAVAVVIDNRPTTNDQRPTTEDRGWKIEDRRSKIAGLPSSILDPRSSVLSPQSSVLSPQSLTYAELNERANRLAHHLRALGVGPERIVAVYMERSLELVVALLGILKAGGAYLPLDPSYPTARLTFMLEDAQTSVLITMTGALDTETRPAPSANEGRQGDKETSSADSVTPSPLHPFTSSGSVVDLRADWSTIAAAPPSNPACRATSDNLAYVIYTSGSTGRPKGVMVPHRGLVNYLCWCTAAYAVADGHGAPVHSSIGFDLTITSLFAPLCVGRSALLLPEDQSGAALGDTLRADADFSLVKLTPAHLELLSQQLSAAMAAWYTRALIVGGEALRGESLTFWRANAPATRIINEYGPTETVVGCCVYEVPTGAAISGAVPIGRPIANTQVYLLDAQMQPVPIGVAGELYIGGVQLARGYLRRPDLTAERFVPNPFAGVLGVGCWVTEDPAPNTQHLTSNTRLYRTGDLARYRPDGDLVYLGRSDEQVKVRGNRVELGEVAAVLSQHAALREAAVLARTDGGRVRLVAYVVTSDKSQVTSSEDSSLVTRHSLLVTELRDFLKTKLPDYMLPAAFVLLEALPLTANGKLDRRALPPPEQARSAPEDAYVAPRTAVEELLAGIWAAVLRRERVGVHENFFALGGDSILSIQIVARANQAGVYLTPRQLFQHQTIAALAAVADTAPTRMIAQELVVGPTPLTPIQRWFFSQEMLEPHHYNQSVLLMAHQPLDAALLDLAVEHLLRHHDALRLRFAQAEDGWHQRQTAMETQVVGLQIDLSALPDTMQRMAIETAAATLQASLDLTDGPIMRVAHFVYGAGQPDRLLLIIHHLAVDGVSWRILLEDLQTVYAQLSRGATVQLPPKTSAFQQWAERLLAYAQSATLHDELAYWLAPRRRGAGRLPLDIPTGANTLESARNLVVSLSAEQTQLLLQDVPAVYRTQINDVLLTALAQTLTAWTGADAVQIELEGHGREELFADVDLTRTVGWFTTLFPVLLDLAGSDGPATALKTIKEQLRAVPNRGIGYGVLRYLTADPALRAQAPAEVVFNYLGQVDQVLSETSLFGPADESRGPEQSPRGMRGHLLEINGVVAGGQLHLSWTYSAALHQHATIARLAQDYLDTLLALIAHCRSPEAGGATPSDFPLAQLDQATLDRLVGADRQIEDLYPLAPMQAGMLFHTLHSPESGVYVEQLSCTFHGDLDLAAFQRAWQVLVERHAILRTAFVWEGLDRPIQVVRARLQLLWVLDDWRALGAADQQARLEAYLSHTRQCGFELAQAPLMRLALFRVAGDVHQFVWTWHHILMDGWSASIIMQELFGAYVALAQGGMVPFGPPPRYRDYIAWLQQQDPGRAEQFWRRYLQGFNAPTPLGVDHAVEAGRQTTRVAEQCGVLPPAQTAALGVLTRRHGITLNVVLQGAWALLLSRYSGEADVVFGATVAGRPPELAGVERMVGLFINTLPVRVQMAPQSPVPAWLHDLHTQQVELRQYEYTPLIQIQGWSAVPRGLPMFESILIFENYPLAEATHTQEHSPQLAIDNVRSMEQTNYPIALIAAPGSALALTISYDAQRFDRTTVERMLSHLQVLLEGMAADRGQRLAELPLLTAGERQQLLVEWNASDRGVRGQGSGVRSAALCIHDLFEAQATRTPDTVAVVFDRPPTNDQRPTTDDSASIFHPPSSILRPQSLTYSELNARANRLAQHLRALGVGPEVRVGICLERSPELLVALLGTLKAGGAYVPLDPAYPAERLAFMLEDAQVAVLLTTTDHRPPTNDNRPPTTDQRSTTTCDDRSTYGHDLSYPNDEQRRPATTCDERPTTTCDERPTTTCDDRSTYGHDLSCPNDEQRRPATTDQRGPTTDQRPQSKIQNPKSKIVHLDADWPLIAEAPPLAPISGATVQNLAYVIYTSGSTGTPKGVMVQHHSLVNLAHAAVDLIGLRLDQRMLQFASFSFDASALQIFPTLISGATLVLHSDPAHLTNHELLEVCVRQQVTVLDLPAAFWQQWVADLAARQVRPPSAIQVYMTGGERIPLERVEQWAGLASQPVRLLSSYGPTEATITATLFATSSDQISGLAMPNLPMGDHLPNIQIYLLDQHIQPVPIGVVGEVHIGGVGLARGYLNRPDLTADRFVPNPFAGVLGDGCWVLEEATPNTQHPSPNTRLYKTGDLARYRLNGSLEFVGRRDTQVKLRGFRIEPGEVEAVLAQHPAVRDAVVLAHEDTSGEQRLVAYVVPKIEDRGLKIEDSGSDAPDPLSSILYPLSSELHAFLQERLPDYMIPSAFVVLDALPLTPHGKLDRQALPAPDHAASPTGESYIPPRDGMELQLVQIWEDLLAARPIGVADDFFALGGHSLHAVALIARIQRQFGQSLPLATLFQEPTIEGLALRLRQQTGSHTYAPLVPIQPGGTKRPFFCVHPAAGNVLCYATLAHYLSPDQPLYGLQARGVEEDQEPFTRVEDMAAQYIAALQAVQPDGPYLLGGWSSGGVVAFEMAQQLRRQGQEVALLALLDTGVPQPDQADNPPSDGDIMIGLLGPELLPLPQDDFLQLAPDEQVSILLEAAKKANKIPPDTDLLQVQRLLKIFKANVLAVSRYNPEIYPHQITLFKSEQSMKDASAATTISDDLDAERARDWAELSVKPILIYPVPGEHMRMLNEPHVRILAEKLQSCLDRHRAEM